MKCGTCTTLASLLLLISFACVRVVERTACPVTCSTKTACGLQVVERYSMRWPVASAVAGALLVGAGGTLVHWGRAETDALQKDVEQTVTMGGDRPFDWDSSREDRAVFMQNAGTALITVGVIAVVTAAVLYFHQKKMVPVALGYRLSDENMDNSK